MSAKARTRAHRRDRRKAKATNYTREGKTNMGRRIGHGTSGSPGGPRQAIHSSTTTSRFYTPLADPPDLTHRHKHEARATIGELLDHRASCSPKSKPKAG